MRKYKVFLKGFNIIDTLTIDADKITLGQGSIIFEDYKGSTICIVPGDSVVVKQ